MPMVPLFQLIPEAITVAGSAHFQNVVNHVGPITEAEVDAKMTQAAQIHSREWNTTSHPLDALAPAEAHDWAIRHIAVNLVARERGYDVERLRHTPSFTDTRVQQVQPLRRPQRTWEGE
jgi:hypothetical protein